MSLNAALARAKTEEDVKDAYIEALGLKGVHKGLVDIQTPEIWFEAKEAPTPPLLMFAQLLVYVRAARKRGEAIPGFLCVMDREKAALMATEHALPLLKDKGIVWPRTSLTSSIYTGRNGGGAWILSDNLERSAIVFSVRRLIKPTWLNDRDQFLQPSQSLPAEFKSDCLVWMLFNGSNLTVGADGLRWNDQEWSLTNHFIPFTEGEVSAKERFESDFMVHYMAGMVFSPEAQAVLDEGRKLFERFHATGFPNKIRQEFKLKLGKL